MRFLWILLALLGGCLASPGMVTVQPVDDGEFQAMVKLLRPQMERRGLVDADGAWYSPRFSLTGAPKNAGAVLLERLSPAFRFPGMAPEQLPPTFKGMLAESAALEVDEHAFRVRQGLDNMLVSLLAVADIGPGTKGDPKGGPDGKDDWIVLCRIEPQSTPGGRRDYYLLIDDLTSPVLVPKVLAIRDCVFGRCEVLTTPDEPGLVQDSAAAETEQGKEAITQPPKTPPLPPRPAAVKPGGRPALLKPLPEEGIQNMGSGLSRETLSQ